MNLPFALLFFIAPTLFHLYFFFVTFKRRMRFSVGKEIAIFATVVAGAAGLCLYYVHGQMEGAGRFVPMVIFIAALIASQFLMFRATVPQIVFTYFLITTCLDCVFSLGKVLQIYWLNDFLPTDISFVVSYTIVLIIIAPLMHLMLGKMLRPLVEEGKKVAATSIWRFLWAIPFLFFIIYKTVISYDYRSPSEYAGDPPVLVILVWSACLLLSYYVILGALAQAAKQAELQEKLRISKLMLSVQERDYRALNALIDETARNQHDKKHYLLLIKSYIESDQLPKLKQMIDHELKDLQQSSVRICENHAANTLIRYYMDLAAAQKIRFEHNVKLPETLAVPEQELCVVVGNILENALEACGRQKNGESFISICAEITGKDVVVLSVKNSYEGTIIPSGNGRFLSAKRTGEGIGIASIQNIALKNNGIVDFRYQDGVFMSRILLNPPHEKD